MSEPIKLPDSIESYRDQIARCKETLAGENEPHVMDWVDMVEGLVQSLEEVIDAVEDKE